MTLADTEWETAYVAVTASIPIRDANRLHIVFSFGMFNSRGEARSRRDARLSAIGY
jgi:hypothetical protein